MRKLSALLSVVAMLVVAACSDSATLPNGASPSSKVSKTPIPATCTTLAALTNLAHLVFDGGGPNAQSVIGKLDNLDKFLQKGDLDKAQSRALDIVSFVQQKAAAGQLAGSTPLINAFIGGVLCYAGLLPNTFLIQPGDDAQVLKSNTGNSGLSLPPHPVGIPTLITITELDPNGPSGLNTKLDQYPSFITITATSPLILPASIAVCVPASLGVPADVFARLRLGHQANAAFELTPQADPSFLGCAGDDTETALSKAPRWLRTLASVFLPTKLYARKVMAASGGGVGGSSTELSPFGAVDEGLFAGGGVGGSSTELQISHGTLPQTASDAIARGRPAKPSFSVYDINGNCISADTTVGLQLSAKCRPVVTVRTGKGTVLTGVPLGWAVTAGGGSIAPANLTTNACGAFASTTSNATDANGRAGVCWTMGPNAGSNAVQATPAPGGDAPNGVVFLDASGAPESGVQFTATGDLIPSSAPATGITVPYDGLAHAGSGTCSNSLTPVLTYNTPGGVVPVNFGSYTLTVTCGTGSTIYTVSTATATISITKRPATATAGSGTMNFGGTVPALPCVDGWTDRGGRQRDQLHFLRGHPGSRRQHDDAGGLADEPGELRGNAGQRPPHGALRAERLLRGRRGTPRRAASRHRFRAARRVGVCRMRFAGRVGAPGEWCDRGPDGDGHGHHQRGPRHALPAGEPCHGTGRTTWTATTNTRIRSRRRR